MCKPVPVHKAGEDIFKLTDSHMTDKGLSRKDCMDVCTDGAQWMIGKTHMFIVHVKAIAPECTNRHCIIDRYCLAVKKRFQTLSYSVGGSCEDCKLHKIKTIELRSFQCPFLCIGRQLHNVSCMTEVRWMF